MDKMRKNLYKIILFVSVLILIAIAFAPFLIPYFVKHNIVFITPIIEKYFKFLSNTGLMGSYIEAFCGLFGAFVGTYLAIRGSLFQYRMDIIKKEQSDIHTAAKLVYYDYYFIENDISKMIPYLYKNIIFKYNSQLLLDNNNDINLRDVFFQFTYGVRPYVPQIFILDNWIEVTSRLMPVLTPNELDLLFDGYGKINSLKKIFDFTTISNAEVYSITSDFLDLFYNSKEIDIKESHFNEQFASTYHNLILKLKKIINNEDLETSNLPNRYFFRHGYK